ncbi:MAG: hypothetical protein ACFFCE_12760 [Promethearchaeota archaeon]
MTEQNTSWEFKWIYLIERLKELIAQEGQEILVLNVEVMKDTETQYKKYMNVVESMKNQLNIVVTRGLVGKQRIFWPYYDVQFYIKEGEEKIQCTGNYEMIQKIIN